VGNKSAVEIFFIFYLSRFYTFAIGELVNGTRAKAAKKYQQKEV